MQIFVKMPVGLTVTLDLDASDAVHYVKTSCWSPDALFHTFSRQKDFTHHLVLRDGWQVFVKPLNYMTTTPGMEASDETVGRGGQCGVPVSAGMPQAVVRTLHIDGLQCPATCSSYPPFLSDPERTLRRIAFISTASAVLIQLVPALLFSGEYCCTDAPPNHVFKECSACMFVYTLSLYIHVCRSGCGFKPKTGGVALKLASPCPWRNILKAVSHSCGSFVDMFSLWGCSRCLASPRCGRCFCLVLVGVGQLVFCWFNPTSLVRVHTG